MRAEAIAKALGGRKSGKGWMACCPAHDDSDPSLSICDKDGTVLVHCFAGCSRQDVIQALKDRGLWGGKVRSPRLRGQASKPKEPKADPQGEEKRKKALATWDSSRPGAGTFVETYLGGRGLTLPVPASIRFHPRLPHPEGGTWPAMVALVTRGTDGVPRAIHRTFLAPDGSGKAPVKPQKMMLGPCSGGAVRLAEPTDVLMVGEGIETCLAAMQATGNPAWAALSTSGMRTLELPAGVREVTILADGDDPGEAAADDCGRRWQREGRRVRIARPRPGMDFNDMLTAHAPHLGEGR